jgi:hypothetical protein
MFLVRSALPLVPKNNSYIQISKRSLFDRLGMPVSASEILPPDLLVTIMNTRIVIHTVPELKGKIGTPKTQELTKWLAGCKYKSLQATPPQRSRAE